MNDQKMLLLKKCESHKIKELGNDMQSRKNTDYFKTKLMNQETRQ